MMRSGKTTSPIAACLLAAPALAFAQQGRAADRVATMDRNGDGVVTREEWTGTADAFDARDWNRDGILSGSEMRPGARRGQERRARDGNGDRGADQFNDSTPERLAALDRNRDGRLTQKEWRGTSEEFKRRDGNQDGVLSGTELNNLEGSREGTRSRRQSGSASQNRSRAYQAGSERGRTEGLEAGRQDRERSQGWDLEGQRELETADSGYTSSLGARAEYQSGYREAFRAAYREGYGR